MYHDHAIVPIMSGDTREDKMNDRFKMKFPDMKTRKMTTPQIKRVNVIGQASP